MAVPAAPIPQPRRRWGLLARVLRVLGIGLLWLAGAALLAASLLSFWTEAAWWLRMVTPFRFQYLLLGGLLLLVGARLRRAWVTRALAVAAIGVNLSILWPWLLPLGDQTPDESFLLMSWNTWSGHPDPQQVIDAVANSGAQLALLCETPTAWRKGATPEIPGYHVYKVSEYLVALEQDIPLTLVSERFNWPPGGFALVIEWQGRELRVFCTHLTRPTSERGVMIQTRQQDWLDKWVTKSTLPTVIAGDFNQTPWCPGLRDVLSKHRLNDASRGHGVAYTYPAQPAYLARLIGVPIDQVFYTSQLTSGRRWVGDANGSNHRPVFVELGWRPQD